MYYNLPIEGVVALLEILQIHREAPILCYTYAFVLIEKETPTQALSCKFCKIFRALFYRTRVCDFFENVVVKFRTAS